MITIRSIRRKITNLKRARRTLHAKMTPEILTDMLDLIEQRVGPDLTIKQISDMLLDVMGGKEEHLEGSEQDNGVGQQVPKSL